jgi:hypothetical protein
MTATATEIEDLMLHITEEIQVRAPVDVTFETLLEQLGPLNEFAPDHPLPMKIEPWPGGRWYRDLGDNKGHFWGHVQAINRPTLLEITGPLLMSYPALSNVQYRLSEEEGGTLVQFHHLALGLIERDHREGVGKGWSYMHARMKQRAEMVRAGQATAH